MEIILGFLIAVAIGITGVGAGIITAPVLILFFHVPPVHAVGTALAFGVAVKVLVVPMQLARKQVDFRVLGYMLAGGVPGVIAGSLVLARLNASGRQGILYAALGGTIVVIAALNLYRVWLRPDQKPLRDHSRWLPIITLPIGAEVSGFQVTAGNYDGAILTRLIIGGVAGAFAGTYLAAIAPQRVLRVVLSLWLISLGIQLCWSGVSHW
jgi:uncharacterized protein